MVIIGAGFDTRAYQFEDLKENVKVFEVDHPVTQQVKVLKIKEIFGELPDHVIYVPVVFGVDRLDRKLLEKGKIEEFFKERGFRAVTNVSSASCKEKSFRNASCGRTVSPMFNFVHATV